LPRSLRTEGNGARFALRNGYVRIRICPEGQLPHAPDCALRVEKPREICTIHGDR
jgi:hypothetical protein